MEMKTTDRTTYNDKQKSDFARVARPSNAFQIVVPHVIHILTYTARARKLSTFHFCSRLLLYRNLFTLLNFNFLFVVALVVYLHYLFIAVDRSELIIGYNNCFELFFTNLKNTCIFRITYSLN